MTRKKKLTPAEIVHEAFGVRPLARFLRINPSSISRWRSRKDVRGKRPGVVPEVYHRRILNLSRMKKAGVTKEHLKHGGVYERPATHRRPVIGA